MTGSNKETKEHTNDEKDIPIVTPEMLMTDVAQAAQAHAAATQAFIDNFEFYGKSLAGWSSELAIPISDKLTPDQYRDLYIKIANNIQIAGHFYSVSNTINSTISGGSSIKKADLVRYLVDGYENSNRSRPAKDIIEKMADSFMKSTVSTQVASRIVKEFWRDRRDILIEVRKNLEQFGISMHSEMKYLNSGDSHAV